MFLAKPMAVLLSRAAALGLLLLIAQRAAAQNPGPPTDPVEELRQALFLQVGDLKNPVALQNREALLAKRSAALKSLGDLRKALALPQWRDTIGGDLGAIDFEARKAIGERLQKGLKNAAEKGDVTTKLAVATLVGSEIGITIRGIDKSFKGFGHSLSGMMAQLAQDSNPEVRVAGLAALGRINPDPKMAAAIFKTALEKDGIPQRRAAADSLVHLIRTAQVLQKKLDAQDYVRGSNEEILAAATEVVPVAVLGFKDFDHFVRRFSLEAHSLCGTTISDLVIETYREQSSGPPPPGQPWTEFDKTNFVREVNLIIAQEKMFGPLTEALGKQGNALVQTLTDPDVQVRMLARRTLEMLAFSRQKLRRQVTKLPDLAKVPNAPMIDLPKFQAITKDSLGKAIKPGLEEIAKQTGDPDVRVRRATIYFLETLEESAAPAVPRLARALLDSDRFVRWSAARSLGRIGAVQADLTVPLLAKVAGDPDIDVSQAASFTLESYGVPARGAVPILIQHLVTARDPDVAASLVYALVSVGAKDPEKVVMPLAGALGSPEVRVRRAAARALATLGPAARPALVSLRRCLQDEDAEVRRAVSEALLNMN